ncbi:hypothetical protein TNCV_1113391 [Trichonephila clavipes]|nr:hypothetical protein TNCV_1113391 [Trichonephila clavipes]
MPRIRETGKFAKCPNACMPAEANFEDQGEVSEEVSQQKISLAIASSSIAATLLNGGQTTHSAFQLPLDIAC